MKKIAKIFEGDKNDRLVMIGFNLGPSLAVTEEGIRSQINEGSISQSSGEKFIYSIPTSHGSSGYQIITSPLSINTRERFKMRFLKLGTY